MSPIELVELVQNSLTTWGYENLQTSDIRSEAIGGHEWIAMDFAGSDSGGLDYSGMGFVTERNERLHLILYIGTRLYHFEKNKDDVVRLVSTLRWIDATS